MGIAKELATHMTTDDLACREFVELVTDYLENRLPSEERLRFEQHMSGCDGCTTYLKQMRQTIQLVGKITEDSLSPDVREELLNRFRNWKRS